MASKKIKPDDLAIALNAELERYSRSIRKGIREAGEQCINEMVDETRATAKKRTGEYAQHIACKQKANTSDKISFLWYVKAPEYRLTHLLNNGYANRGGGRTPGDGHVTTAAEHAKEHFWQLCKEVIQGGH